MLPRLHFLFPVNCVYCQLVIILKLPLVGLLIFRNLKRKAVQMLKRFTLFYALFFAFLKFFNQLNFFFKVPQHKVESSLQPPFFSLSFLLPHPSINPQIPHRDIHFRPTHASLYSQASSLIFLEVRRNIILNDVCSSSI